jgi:nucleoside-triphosphatase THEP1
MGRFDELSDLDFEELVADLMQVELVLPLRAGTRGRDNGIDVLAVEGDEQHVVQCKHYRTGDFANLRTAVKKEAAKLSELNPTWSSYRFATSMRLNHARREELAELLKPWVSSIDDIYAEGDLKSLLRKHDVVEGRHVKLWLSGAGPLKQLLNAAAYERSRALLEDTRAALPRYVQTEAYGEAREILRKESVCVIAGPPGVGKTTLARLLLLNALEEGFQPYEIAPGGLRDAWQLLEADEDQIFYFDDFLGQTALHESRHHDADLLKLMRKIARTPKKRFVLATREYILRQAKQLSEALDRETDDAHRFLLTIDRYSRHEKARIFYNHIYYSADVNEIACRSLLRNRGYITVIDHPAYNPRLIEWITGFSAHRLSEAELENYASYCVRVLNKPGRLWSHAFESGLDEAESAVLISMLGLPRRVSAIDLEQAFETACEAREINSGRKRFIRALNVLDDSFLSSDGAASLHVSFINPSVIDFLRQYLLSSRSDATLAIRSAHFFEQVEWLWAALSNKSASPPAAFAADFRDAISRTLRTQPAEGTGDALSFPSHPGGPVSLQERLIKALEFLRKLPAGNPPQGVLEGGRVWLDAISEGRQSVSESSPKLMRTLADLGAFDLAYGVGVIKTKLATSGVDDVAAWACQDELQRQVPTAYTPTERAEAREAFDSFFEDALEEPAAYGLVEEDLWSVEDLIGGLDSKLEYSAVEQARDRLAEEESEGEVSPPDFEPEDWEPDDRGGGFGGEDDEIDAIFDRLG